MAKFVLAYRGGSVDASGLDDATAKAKGCPVLASGGTVDVYEAMEM